MANRKVTVLNPAGYQEQLQSGDVAIFDNNDIVLGTNKITLDAGDGSITAAGIISNTRDDASSQASVFVHRGLISGTVQGTMVYKTAGNLELRAGASDVKINLDGETGAISVAGGLARIDKFGQMNVNTPASNGYAFQSRILGGDATCIIEGDGSITASNTIQSDAVYITGGDSDWRNYTLFQGDQVDKTGNGSRGTVFSVDGTGSIRAAGGIRSLGDPYAGVSEGVLLNGGPDRDFPGSIDVCRDGAASLIWKGWQKGIGSPTSQITAGGEITAAGGATFGTSSNCRLQYVVNSGNNSVLNIRATGSTNNAATALNIFNSSGTSTVSALYDGTATFAGSITAASATFAGALEAASIDGGTY